MNVTLAENEKILKEWNYSTESKKLDKRRTQKVLTVTNMRLIVTEETEFAFVYKELPIGGIKGISAFYRDEEFYLVISTNATGSFTLGVEPDEDEEEKRGISKLYVYMGKELAQEIVTTLGAIILDKDKLASEKM